MALGHIKPVEPVVPPEGGGTITGLTWQRKDADRCSIHMDGSYAFGLHASIVTAEGLHNGKVLGEADCRRMLAEDLYYRVLKRIMQFVGYRPRSTKEVTERMRRLGADEAVAARILDRLTEWNMIDDTDFAKRFAESRLRRHGPQRVRVDLIMKGIAPAMADAVLADAVDPEALSKQLDELVLLTLKRYRREADDGIRQQKTIRYLMRRGYDAEAIRSALARLD